jgi:hypothetical protein
MWQLEVNLHWPHNRFALGWEYIEPIKTENFSTYTLYLFIMTVQFHVFHD